MIPARMPIPGLIGYEIDTDGQGWSRWEKISLGGRAGTSSVLGETLKPLKPIIDNAGYPRLWCKGKFYRIHRLVLLTFVGPCPPRMQACHNDGNPGNPKLSNLRWDTHKANQRDSFRHGTKPIGMKCWKAKLTDDDVRAIRSREGEGIDRLAAEFSVSRTTIKRVLSGASGARGEWSHVQ